MLYGRLLDNNSHRCESLADLSYPVVLLQRGESRGDRFIESLRRDLYGVLNVSKILYRNRARPENHNRKRSIFAFCSPSLDQTQQSTRSTPFVMWHSRSVQNVTVGRPCA
jgi:hypothetical protein